MDFLHRDRKLYADKQIGTETKKTRHTMWSSENLENSSWDSIAENRNKKFGEFVSFLKEAYSFLSVLSGARLVIPFSIIIL